MTLGSGKAAADGVACPVTSFPYLAFAPESLDSRQLVTVTAGLHNHVPSSVSVTVANGQMDVTLYANLWLGGPPPPDHCAQTVVGPFEAGIYAVNMWLVDLPDYPTPVLRKQSTLEINPALRGVNGLWWNPSESGWGVNLTQRGNIVFGVWFTYDSAGNPRWYVAPHCELPSTVLAGASCTETLYKAEGGAVIGKPFDPKAVSISPAGRITLDFQSGDAGRFSYILDGVVRTTALSRQPFGSGAIAGRDFTDLWWNSSESGWGLSITQQGSVLFLAWFVYDESGKPKWYVASNCALLATIDGCNGTLYEAKGPPFGAQFESSLVTVTVVGNISVKFLDANNGEFSYTIEGVSGQKRISRQLF